MSSNGLYHEKYLGATREIKLLIDSSTIPECTQKAINAGLLLQKQKKIVTKSIAELRLGMFGNDILLNTLREAGVSNPDLVFSHINTCIHNTPTHYDSLEISKNEFELLSAEVISTDIAETEATLKKLSPMRTMAGDMHTLQGDHEPTYHSSQDNILATRNTPPPPQPDSRWGSS